MNNQKAQGSLEYLLLIGGGVLIAALVLALLAGVGTTGQTQGEGAGNEISNSYDAIQAGLFPPGGAVCNNGVIEGAEQCDPITQTTTCSTLSLPGGNTTVSCTATCSWNTSVCTSPTQTCGNNIIEGIEICDGTALNGQKIGRASCRERVYVLV